MPNNKTPSTHPLEGPVFQQQLEKSPDVAHPSAAALRFDLLALALERELREGSTPMAACAA
jgi:hypothetical protein